MKNSLLLFCVFLLMVSCAKPIPRKPVTRKSSSYMEKSVSFNKSLNAAEEEVFKTIIKQDSLNHYYTSPSGFWYTYNSKGKGNYKPKFGDKIYYTFEVFDVNRKSIYTSQEIDERTYVIDQQEILEGLRNGLKLMVEGDVITFLFPSHKMYGYLGDNNKIENNQPLIYKVQLNKIERKNESN